MSAQLSEVLDPGQDAPLPQQAEALLRTVVVADLCDSTALVESLGDQRAAELIRGHDKLLRQLIREHRGQEIDKTDGFLSLFARPIQAVAFALSYQRALQAYGAEAGVSLRARIGVHVGEVMVWRNEADDVERGAKPTEVEGLAKPVAARLMGLALPGQILVSQMAYVLAHRAEGELGSTLARLQWKAHGRFRFKGVADAVTVYEIGEPGIAPFRAPAWTGKAHREVPLWRRPAMIAVELVLLAALIALPLWHYLRPTPAIAFAERDWVVLADLRNLTGDPQFDGSLDQAFRIGLEQSRHVNVVSDLKLRRTLELMRLDPGKALIDRRTGSELAQRENARLLVLPTLAEFGGRLRLTVELVDPYSQTTLYSTTTDSSDAGSLVSGIDEAVLSLRQALGEAMHERPEGEIPLARASTANLDALRAYSLGIRAVSQGRAADAEALFHTAIELDPEFALARVGLAESLRGQANRQSAVRQLERALELSERLPLRERLIAQANYQMLRGEGEQAIRTWSTAAELYPDSYPAHGGLAWAQWMHGLDVAAALRAAQISATNTNPFRAAGVYLVATLLLAAEDYEGAQQAFQEARELRQGGTQLFEVALYAAQTRWTEAEARLMQAEAASTSPLARWYLLQFKFALAVDRGEWEALQPLLAKMDALAVRLESRQQRATAALKLLGSALIDDRQAFVEVLQGFAADEVGRDPSDPESAMEQVYRKLLAATLAASRQLPESARMLLREAELAAPPLSSPAIRALLAATEARLAALEGRAGQGRALLETLPLQQEAHWILSARAEVAHAGGAQDEVVAALRESSRRRGLAYTENRGDRSFLAVNLAFANLAALALARPAEHGPAQISGGWRGDTLPAGAAEMLQALKVESPLVPE